MGSKARQLIVVVSTTLVGQLGADDRRISEVVLELRPVLREGKP